MEPDGWNMWEHTINMRTSSITKYSPYELVNGRKTCRTNIH